MLKRKITNFKNIKVMIAKNNVFNIRAGQAQWVGMTGTRKGFVEFDTREHAIRAWLVLMRNYRRWYDCKTIRRIVTRFAPPTENQTERYIRYCCEGVMLDADCPLPKQEDYAFLGKYMARMETGTAVTANEILEVMNKYNIEIV